MDAMEVEETPAAAEQMMLIKIKGKWRGEVTVPVSSTVKTLQSHIAAKSEIPPEQQQLLFKGKKLLEPDCELSSIRGMKNKSCVFLRCTKVQPVSKMPDEDEEGNALKEKLAAQGAGTITLETAKQYLAFAKRQEADKPVVIKAIQLFYKSHGHVAAAKNIVDIETATAKAATAAATAPAPAPPTEVADEKAATETLPDGSTKTATEGGDGAAVTKDGEKLPKKKKKKWKYKDEIKRVLMRRQKSSDEREAHLKKLQKNLGGGKFKKLDKI